MNPKFHVITPLARFENLADLKSILENQNITWHVITDDDAKETVEFTEDWIKHYVCPNAGMEYWARCNNSINWFIETQEIIEDEIYCFMNDDDGYEPQFFSKMTHIVNGINENKIKCDVMICSMERGHNMPLRPPPLIRHATTKLVAHPNFMHVGSVGVEQIFMTGKVLSENRIPLDIVGDGMMIRRIVRNYPTAYIPEISVWFNYLEPGRWNK